MKYDGRFYRRTHLISPIAPPANHAILNHLRGRHSQVAKATVCKIL